MCRLFGFRSIIPSQVHTSLVAAENALGTQSNEHPDGWGVAYYVEGTPHITKSPYRALGDQLFHRLSGVVSSETVVAHVRKATQGDTSLLNCHPFQYGRWVFAHNGDIPSYSELRGQLLGEVSPRLRRFVLGDTDSETVFFIFLSELERSGQLNVSRSLSEVVDALRRTYQVVARIFFENRSSMAVVDRNCVSGGLLLTVLVSNGELMAALHGGKELYVSTYKKRCSERERCPSLSAVCEAPSTTGLVNHLIVSSEPLQGENVWQALGAGDIVAVDGQMRTMRASLERHNLPIVA